MMLTIEPRCCFKIYTTIPLLNDLCKKHNAPFQWSVFTLYDTGSESKI